MVVKQCMVFDRAILQIKRWERQRKFVANCNDLKIREEGEGVTDIHQPLPPSHNMMHRCKYLQDSRGVGVYWRGND